MSTWLNWHLQPSYTAEHSKTMTRKGQDHNCCVGEVAGSATRWGSTGELSLQAGDQQEEERHPTERQ